MKDFTKEMLEQIKAEIEKSGQDPGSIDELNEIAGKIMDNHNNAGLQDFMGLSPHKMHLLLNHQLKPNCPVKFKSYTGAKSLNTVPIIRISSLFINALKSVPEIKLTANGNIPIKLLKEIYNLNIRYDYFDISPRTEHDSVPAAYGKVLLKISGIIKIQKNKMSLTKFGAGADTYALYKALFSAYTEKFHKGYLDGYESENIGNLGSLYVLYLLKRFGKETRSSDFYASHYIKAFPALVYEFQNTQFTNREKLAGSCFTYRIFNKGLFLFGLVDLGFKKKDNLRNEVLVRSTDLLNELFEID